MNVQTTDLEPMLECVAFLLIRDGMLLAERRNLTKTVMPGILAIPGGHCDPGEAALDALHRELHEELALTATAVQFVCTLLHRSAELRRLHYYAVTAWSGELQVQEAESVDWVPLTNAAALDLDVDRLAVAVYLHHLET